MAILSGMKMAMPDDDGKQLFPITTEMLRNARAGTPGVLSQQTHDQPLNDEEDPGFSIGVDTEV